ncbi:alpha-L-fucosidase [Pinibacter aurantiacus]|uniref:Alpha-L-fucosidase n=1 Tax=Pinibacter aurantiacus TaxID=2851599 RepID=A0A9E2S999_9BACT|nr:alpha-L-fucosidase [Pinibacter aurantiacus]MBV4358731.1 alpha-L-fucosidase [Pinibacter aurantiacus]
MKRLTSSFFLIAFLQLSLFSQEKQMIQVSTTAEPIDAGKFSPTWQSLSQYEVPEWFRNAKFGIWAHWGPQCQPEMGDWYARGMYEENSWQYKSHLEKYGHPSKSGFKDIIHEWKAENWEPEKLVALYKRTGAQYFFAMANHHDNLDMWDSKYQEWNTTRVGPKKNIIDGWAKAAKKYKLPFGLSVHASHAWMWYETAQRADTAGPYKGIPYDGKLTKADGKGTWWEGLDPQELYAQNHPLSTGWGWEWNNGTTPPSQAYCQKFFNRTMDLINQYNPDLLYFDDSVLPLYPLSDAGLKLAAHYYNHNMATHSGKLQGVLFGKILSDEQKKCMVWDVERGAPDKLQPLAWQTCSCIGDWHYNRGRFTNNSYKSAKEVILMLVDIVSKNGNLLLNIPVRGDGTIDEREIETLNGIAAWMNINKESIFNTRPWRIFGEGPTADAANPIDNAGFNEGKTKFSEKDIRFAQNKNILYATVMGAPTDAIKITALGNEKIKTINLLGSSEAIKWKKTDGMLVIEKPKTIPNNIATVFKIVKQN